MLLQYKPKAGKGLDRTSTLTTVARHVLDSGQSMPWMLHNIGPKGIAEYCCPPVYGRLGDLLDRYSSQAFPQDKTRQRGRSDARFPTLPEVHLRCTANQHRHKLSLAGIRYHHRAAFEAISVTLSLYLSNSSDTSCLVIYSTCLPV